MAKKFKCYGINEDTDTCEACGKRGLKRVVWLAPIDSDGNEATDPAPYGTDCAGRMMGWSYGAKKTVEKLNQMHQRKMEEDVDEALRRTVEENQMVIFARKFMLPPDLFRSAMSGEITGNEAWEERNRRFPIMKYNNGIIRLEEAYEMIKA